MTDQQLESVALADLIVDINVRTDIKLDKSFVSSIRNHGILQPPIGWRGDDGKVRITAGQRRTLAAMELELTEIDVIIKPQEIAEAARIVTQLTENDQRQELTDSERLHGYKQLVMFGVTADQIARKTNKPRAHVTQALAVAESDIAADALASYPINLEQAAVIAEFGDDVDAVERLLTIAQERPSAIVHEAQRIRDVRRYEAAAHAADEELAAQGWEILTERPGWSDTSIVNIHSLWLADDPKRTPLTLEQASEIEGRAALVHEPGWHDREAGALYGISYYIREPQSKGLATHDSSSPKPPATADEKAAKKADRQRSADLRSATTVRRAWLHDSLLANGRKINVPDVIALIADALLDLDTSASEGKYYAIAAELLDIEYEAAPKGSYDPRATTAVRDALLKGADPLRIALAVAIARTESVLGDPTGWPNARNSRTTVEYYQLLEGWGYTLSDVEAAIAHPKKGSRK